MEFKDLFSTQAVDYSKFRPHYPAELFQQLARLTPLRRRCWDCGTGNGQAAVALAAYYDEVLATDPSPKQLAAAQAHPKVKYSQAPAEHSGLADRSIDLITVAQAFHWFKHAEFFKEARRVAAAEGAVLAIWSYALCRVAPEIDELVLRYYHETVGRFWEPERRQVEEGYAGIAIPFPELKLTPVAMTAEWTVEHMLGYLGTWSATQAASRALGADPLAELRKCLPAAWPPGKIATVRFDLTVRAFQI